MPYRTPAPRIEPAVWRVTWWQKQYVRIARRFVFGPFDTWQKYARECRRYERALLRWRRDYGDRRVDRTRPNPVPPAPPPIPIFE